MIPQQQQSDPLGQVGIFLHLFRNAGDADDGHRTPVKTDGHIDAVAHIQLWIIFFDGDDLPGPGRFMAAHVIAAHPVRIRTGADPSVDIDIVNVMAAYGL